MSEANNKVKAFIGIGSNLGNAIEQVQFALTALGEISGCEIEAVSSFYCTHPWGMMEQPFFINCVVALNTVLQPLNLLMKLREIENNQGRVRTENRNGPRSLDLDILLYGDQIIQTSELEIPHPRMLARDFVVYPLAEIEPNLIVLEDVSIQHIKTTCETKGIYRLEDVSICHK